MLLFNFMKKYFKWTKEDFNTSNVTIQHNATEKQDIS